MRGAETATQEDHPFAFVEIIEFQFIRIAMALVMGEEFVCRCRDEISAFFATAQRLYPFKHGHVSSLTVARSIATARSR